MKKTTTLISLFLFIVNVGLSQFSQLKQRPAINQSNLLHSCIAKSSSNSSFYILATTVQVGNTNNIALQKLDTNGITIWEKEVFYSSDDKVLDVIVDKKDDIIIVGYTQKTGKKQLLIAKYNTNGVLINDFILHSQFSIIGTKIIESKLESSYYIGGFEFEDELPFNMVGHGLVLAVSTDLNIKKWEKFYKGTDVNNSITDIVELPNKKLFLTGSIGHDIYGQDVFAAIVDPLLKGAITPNGNLSFSLNIDASLGASAVYNSADDEISLLFNSGITNNMFITTISNATTASPTATYTGLKMDIRLLDGYSGFKLLQSIDDPDNLVIVGYYKSFPQQNIGLGIFVMEVDKVTGVLPVSIKLWNPTGVNTGVQFEGGDVLSLFSSHTGANSPYFHTPNIAVTSHNSLYYVGLTPDKISNYTEVGIIEFDKRIMFASSPCLKAVDYTPGTFEADAMYATEEKSTSWHSNPKAEPESVFFIYPLYCQMNPSPIISETGSRNSVVSSIEEENTGLAKLNCYPNPVMNELTISIPGSEIMDVKVFDMIGNLVTQSSYSSVSKSTLDTHDWIKGMYLVHVISSDGLVSKSKIIKN